MKHAAKKKRRAPTAKVISFPPRRLEEMRPGEELLAVLKEATRAALQRDRSKAHEALGHIERLQRVTIQRVVEGAYRDDKGSICPLQALAFYLEHAPALTRVSPLRGTRT